MEPVVGDGRDAHPVEGAGGDVRLAPDDESRALEQLGLVPAELLEEHALLLLRASPLDAREVEEQDEHARALDVAQELMTEPPTLRAPSMSPGMSASTSSCSSKRTTPRCGSSVVNG